jgi:hypothetical protein
MGPAAGGAAAKRQAYSCAHRFPLQLVLSPRLQIRTEKQTISTIILYGDLSSNMTGAKSQRIGAPRRRDATAAPFSFR